MSYYSPYASNLSYHPGNMSMNPVCYPPGPQFYPTSSVGYGRVGYGHGGYHDPYYASRTSQFYDDGYFRNRYAAYYDLYPESAYMGGSRDRFPTYLDYLRDRVRSYETEYYPYRDRYSSSRGYGSHNSGHWNSPYYRDSYMRGRYYDIGSSPNRISTCNNSLHNRYDPYGSRASRWY